ncbi:MAG TPA: hypothetical protein P5332_06140 [Ignavibacteriales bacterium]|nr:hypothetical protein [Ignavibacteriales bacterium]
MELKVGKKYRAIKKGIKPEPVEFEVLNITANSITIHIKGKPTPTDVPKILFEGMFEMIREITM